MGELEGIRGAWGYPEGGMGAVSDAIAKSAQEAGADIVVESPVKEVIGDMRFFLDLSIFELSSILVIELELEFAYLTN